MENPVAVPRTGRLRTLLGLALTGGALALAITPDAEAYGPGCPYCNTGALGLVVGGGDPMLFVSVKWSGISQSPSVANPSLVCQSSFKTMMWRRHERGSDCIIIPQARITMRSGGAIQQSDYLQFADLDTSTGVPGDINVVSGTALDDTWAAADIAWAAQPKGVISLSCNRLIDGAGTSVARGVAYVGSITRPWMAVADPTVFCQLNERSLTHELGHVLSLGHVGTGGNLMQTGGTGSTLTLAQATTMRNYINANPILDPPAGGVDPNWVGMLFDARRELPPGLAFLDLFKIVVNDLTPTGGDVHLSIGTDGFQVVGDVMLEPQYWVAMDTDNDPMTGRNASELVPGLNMPGVDFVAEINWTRRDGAVPTLWRALQFGFIPLELGPELLEARLRVIPLAICDQTGQHTPEFLPKFEELDLRIGRTVLGAGGPDGAFPANLRTRVAIAPAKGGEPVDVGPPPGEDIMRFPRIVFPTIFAPTRAQRGQTVNIRVTNMPPNRELMAFFGQFDIVLDVMSDAAGGAMFPLTIPEKSPLGPTLTTVGINDPANAITADTMIIVVLCIADLDGDGVVGTSDLARMLGAWGLDGDTDLNGDGQTNAIDLAILLGAWGACRGD